MPTDNTQDLIPFQPQSWGKDDNGIFRCLSDETFREEVADISLQAASLFLEHSVSGKWESPIEARLASAIWLLSCQIAALPGNYEIQIRNQVWIGKYRADLCVSLKGENEPRSSIIVECDGHDFHERTKQQAAADKSRDRHLTGLGYRVLRFTGSEIYNKPFLCANEVLMMVVPRGHK